MRQIFLIISDYLALNIFITFCFSSLNVRNKMAQEAFILNNKAFVNSVWYKRKTMEVSQKPSFISQIFSLLFRFLYFAQSKNGEIG